MLDAPKVQDLLTRARREVDRGLLPSCQVALARDGEVEVFEVFGDATPDTRYVVFSCTKALVASAMWLLIGEGRVDPAQKVTEFLPEFGTNGKDVVTVEQVMLHTGGFPRAPLGPPEWATREGRLARYAQWRLNWDPGTASEYHPTSGHWVLADIITTVSGTDYRQFIADRITGPLALTKLQLGVPPEQQGDVAKLVAVGEIEDPEEVQRLTGRPTGDVGEVTEDALVSFNLPDTLAVGVPGGGAVSTAADLTRFYQALLHNTGGLWDDAVLTDAKTNVRHRMPDQLLGVPGNRTLGLMTAGDDDLAAFRGMGRTCSPGTFGHNGAGGQIAWADPATGLSFAYVTNGLDRDPLRQGRRGTAVSSLAAVCAPRRD